MCNFASWVRLMSFNMISSFILFPPITQIAHHSFGTVICSLKGGEKTVRGLLVRASTEPATDPRVPTVTKMVVLLDPVPSSDKQPHKS